LQLRVADTGVKSWHWRFYWRGKRARPVLGIWPDTSLGEAHEKASAARAFLRRGIDPRRAVITLAQRLKSEKPAPSGTPGFTGDHLAREFTTGTFSDGGGAPSMFSEYWTPMYCPLGVPAERVLNHARERATTFAKAIGAATPAAT
jgi:Arm DNA-binding domain